MFYLGKYAIYLGLTVVHRRQKIGSEKRQINMVKARQTNNDGARQHNKVGARQSEDYTRFIRTYMQFPLKDSFSQAKSTERNTTSTGTELETVNEASPKNQHYTQCWIKQIP